MPFLWYFGWTPMVAIQGGLEMIKEIIRGEDPEDLDEYIDMAQNSSGRLLSMINYLLEINKLESGEVQLETTPIVITDLLNDIQTRLSPQAREAKITFVTDYPSTLPILELDPELMGRVFHNILDNAIKFTPDGGQIEITAAANGENRRLILCFKDNGPGIPPNQIEKIFHKYHRVANIESRRSGSGLGLAFSRLVVEAHGGEIWAESEPGEGSTFIISLPITE